MVNTDMQVILATVFSTFNESPLILTQYETTFTLQLFNGSTHPQLEA
jgi:hypothetical protein